MFMYKISFLKCLYNYIFELVLLVNSTKSVRPFKGNLFKWEPFIAEPCGSLFTEEPFICEPLTGELIIGNTLMGDPFTGHLFIRNIFAGEIFTVDPFKFLKYDLDSMLFWLQLCIFDFVFEYSFMV